MRGVNEGAPKPTSGPVDPDGTVPSRAAAPPADGAATNVAGRLSAHPERIDDTL